MSTILLVQGTEAFADERLLSAENRWKILAYLDSCT
jgi:hypothetical protein